MKDIQIIDLIITDINKFLIKQRINPLNVNLIQFNGVPCKCEGNISDEQKELINDHLERYKDKWNIYKLIINYHYGSITEMKKKTGKTKIDQSLKNLIKRESELHDLINCETVIKLK